MHSYGVRDLAVGEVNKRSVFQAALLW